MAATGYDWGAWAFAEDSGGGDWNADALADAADEISDGAIDLDVKAACEVIVFLEEDNTGAITGEVTVYVLGDGGGGAGTVEDIGIGSPFSFNIIPVQNDVVVKRFMVDPAAYGTFRVGVDNNSGQELAVTVKFRTATWPVAS